MPGDRKDFSVLFCFFNSATHPLKWKNIAHPWKPPRATASLGRGPFWREYCALGFSLGLLGPKEGTQHFPLPFMAPAQMQGETCCSETGGPANNTKENPPAGIPSSASFQPLAELKEPSPGLAEHLPRTVTGNSAWDWRKSSSAFSTPCTINRGCAAGRVAGSLAFAFRAA